MKWRRFSIIYYLFLTVLPFLLFLFGLILLKAGGPYYLRSVDPEYPYLMNSLALDMGKVKLYVDHPGTPLHLLMAVTNRVVHLISHTRPFIEDVIANPERYMRSDSLVIFSFISLVLLSAGILTFRWTKNLMAAVFIQFTPFISEPAITIIERLMPEPVFFVTILLLIVYLLADLNNKIQNLRILKNKPLMYGLICGLNLALKFTFVPFLIVPLFILKEKKKIFKYLAFMIAAFFVFAFPILVKFNSFYHWIRDLLIHSGRYGAGEANFIDVNLFRNNFTVLFQQTRYFFLPIFISIILIFSLFIRRLKMRITDSRYINLVIGLSLALIIHVLIVSKHYSLHYMIPAFAFIIFLYYLIIQIVKKLFFPNNRIFESLLYVAIIAMFVFSPQGISHFGKFKKFRQDRFEKRWEAVKFLHQSKLNDEDSFIFCSDNWNIKKELGLWFGKIYAPGNNMFTPIMNKYYKDTYFYKEGWKTFLDWNNEQLKLSEIVEKHAKLNIIINTYDGNVRNELIEKLKSVDNYTLKREYSDPDNNLFIYSFFQNIN